MQQTLSPSAHVVNGQFHSPRNGGWVAVSPDGSVYRWRRNDGRVTRTSTTAFLTQAEAEQAAAAVAQCYAVRFVGVL